MLCVIITEICLNVEVLSMVSSTYSIIFLASVTVSKSSLIYNSWVINLNVTSDMDQGKEWLHHKEFKYGQSKKVICPPELKQFMTDLMYASVYQSYSIYDLIYINKFWYHINW